MMKRLSLAFVLFLFLAACSNREKMALVVPDPQSDAAQKAALVPKNRNVHIQTLDSLFFAEKLLQYKTVWIHVPQKDAWEKSAKQIDFSFLRQWYEQGGRLLLSGFACKIPAISGIESTAPEARPIEVETEGMGTKYGFQGFRGHPVFAGLFGGVQVLHTSSSFRDWRIAYFDSLWPEQGKVIAIEKQHFFYQHDTKSIWEYQNRQRGHILCISGFLHFDRENLQKPHAIRLVNNSLHYLRGNTFDIQPTYWVAHDNKPLPFEPESFSCKPQSVDPQRLEKTGLSLSRTTAKKTYCEAAGRRILVMGKEKGGLNETWVHPFRLFKGFRLGLLMYGNILWLDDLPSSFVNRPESFTRTYRLSGGILKETVFADQTEPAGYVLIENISDQAIDLVLQSEFDQRLMWPYKQNVLGPVRYGYDKSSHTVHISNRSESVYCMMGATDAPKHNIVGPYQQLRFQDGKLTADPVEQNSVLFGALYTLGAQDNMRILFSGSDQGREEAVHAYRTVAGKGIERYNKVVSYYNRFLNQKTVLISPDTVFNKSYLWKLVAIDRFFVNTPPYGRAMVAGMGTTERGWGGGHRISGRPGYAWYFGRDAVWSCFAVDNYGDFESVKKQLYFFAEFQDLTGKIFHELSTSGGLHYDAADATPLYIMLAAHYLRSSGDVNTIRELWPSLSKAMDYLYSTDTDGDGLIENTRVGHGWIEGGKLYGAHTTFYLAGLWCQTLKDAAYMGNAIGKTDRVDAFLRQAKAVQDKLNRDFYIESKDFFSLGLWPDGSLHTEKTIVPSVPMIFGLLDSSKTKTMLDEWGSNRFSTDWGVRIVSTESPLFNPRGYHYGSIWPLFSGWTALAEYRYGRPRQGFRHIMNTMNIFDDWGLGYTEEVLHGLVYRPTGVCSHQCWSETNAVHPLVTGMLGFEPNALENSAFLFPRVPLQWDSLQVKNLRLGNSYFDLKMNRDEKITWKIKLVKGEPVHIVLRGRNNSDWPLVDIETLSAAANVEKDRVSFLLQSEESVDFIYKTMPDEKISIPDPEPGQVSQK